MTEQSFSVSNKPRVLITHVRGNLTVRPWRERQIRVTADGPISKLYQEGESVFVDECESNLEVWIPNMRPMPGGMTTDVSIKDLQGNVFIDGAGNLELEGINGNVELERVWGNLRAKEMPSLHGHKGIGASATLERISRVELGAVGSSLTVRQAEFVTAGAVGSSLDADSIGARLQCAAVGGNCRIANSRNAEVAVSNVGGSLQMNGVAHMHSCNVGGSLQLDADFPIGSSTHLLVGGSATVTLPERANLSIHAIVGGAISGEMLTGKRGNFLNVSYGEGTAKLSLTVGGSLHLLGKSEPSSTNAGFQFDFADFGQGMSDFGRGMADLGREMANIGRDIFSSVVGTMPNEPKRTSKRAQQREAILRMVAEGRLTPEEGNMLLDALEE